jgi:endoglucanase
MSPREFCELARRLLSHPAAPYHEQATRREVERICSEHGLDFRRDAFGNVVVQLQTAPKERAIVLAAHLDHPGFEIVRKIGNGRWLARFCGGVPDEYFRAGVPVRLMPGGARGKLGRVVNRKQRAYEVHATGTVTTSPSFAVWELEDFAVRGDRIYARACDDLIGVASILATLIELKRSRARVNVMAALSRAEEVGFGGALTLGGSRGLPGDALVISLETSHELPGVQMGQGVILRVGDRSSVFSPIGMRFLSEVAANLNGAGRTTSNRKQKFLFQRGLMSGGTCEGTAYQELGFQTAAVCVALGNYHNCAPGKKIASEYVSIADACGMVSLLVATARQMPHFETLVRRLPDRLEKLAREAQSKLFKTAQLML